VAPLPKIVNFRAKEIWHIKFFSHFEFEDEQLAKFKQSFPLVVNPLVLNDKNVHLAFGHYFKISCLATLVLFFYHKKSIEVKKNGHKCNKKKQ
jgi:hypothetical protein